MTCADLFLDRRGIFCYTTQFFRSLLRPFLHYRELYIQNVRLPQHDTPRIGVSGFDILAWE